MTDGNDPAAVGRRAPARSSDRPQVGPPEPALEPAAPAYDALEPRMTVEIDTFVARLGESSVVWSRSTWDRSATPAEVDAGCELGYVEVEGWTLRMPSTIDDDLLRRLHYFGREVNGRDTEPVPAVFRVPGVDHGPAQALAAQLLEVLEAYRLDQRAALGRLWAGLEAGRVATARMAEADLVVAERLAAVLQDELLNEPAPLGPEAGELTADPAVPARPDEHDEVHASTALSDLTLCGFNVSDVTEVRRPSDGDPVELALEVSCGTCRRTLALGDVAGWPA